MTFVYEGAVPAGGDNDENDGQTQFNVPHGLQQDEAGDGWEDYLEDLHQGDQGWSPVRQRASGDCFVEVVIIGDTLIFSET